MIFTHKNLNIFLGPPGTGKTTTLLNTIDQELQNGVDPNKIGFISFTRKATLEAISRACDKFKFEPEQLPYFRTIHSMAFMGLGMTRSQVMSRSHYREFGKLTHTSITGMDMSEEGIVTAGAAIGDRMLFCDHLARIRMIDLYDQWRRLADDQVKWELQSQFSRNLVKFKRERALLDFTDMLERYPEEGFAPNIEVLIVDEAQDLSALQWQVVKYVSRGAKRVYVAGDDDQAIYRWAGADVEQFIGLRGNVSVLSHSYRLPKLVHATAMGILKNIRHRREKVFSPREIVGGLSYHNSFDEIDLSTGSWLILARNNYQLEPLEEHCRVNGYSYESKNFSLDGSNMLTAIRSWEHLRKGNTLMGTLVKKVYSYMGAGVSIKKGYKNITGMKDDKEYSLEELKKDWGLVTDKIWHESLNLIDARDHAYILSALKRGESLTKTPRIKISTIHGAKGGEADNVMLLTDMSAKTYEGFKKNPDDEHRVFYVGVTRSRQNLHIVSPSGGSGYVI